MVTPLSLYVFAAFSLLLAGIVARFRRLGRHEALADLRTAVIGALAALLVASALFAAARASATSELWRAAGSVALMASPLAAALALRSQGRRSLPRSLLASALALAGVALWLTLDLRGPRAWMVSDVALALPAASVAVAAAACLGWWSKRAPGGESKPLPGR